MGNLFCRGLAEYNGQLVKRCNFWHLTEGLPIWVTLIYAAIILTGLLTLGFIMLRLTLKKIIYLRRYNKPYSGKDIKELVQFSFLSIIFLGSALFFIIQLFLYL
jgi:flagellar biosynthesis protein FlhB